MPVVVLRTTALGEDHAVLVVSVDGEAFLLDNLWTDVVSANSMISYRPYHSINEVGCVSRTHLVASGFLLPARPLLRL